MQTPGRLRPADKPCVYLVDKKTRESHELPDGAIVGRDPASDIVIDDKSVSRAHAQVEHTEEGILLRDLGSSRGTFVGREKVGSVLLRPGMAVAFGGARFEVVESLQAETFDPRVAPLSRMQFKPAAEVWDPLQLQNDYERLRVVYELNRSLGLARDFETVLRRVLETAFELLSAERGLVRLFDVSGAPQTVGYTRRGPAPELELSETVVEEVVRERKGIIVADAQVHDTFSRAASIAVDGVRSVMCVPLLYESDVLGVIQVDSLHASHAFEPRDLVLFSSIASQTAVVLREIAHQRRDDQVARMALVGQVAGGLARDLHALLDSVAEGARALKAGADGGAMADTAEAMVRGLERASDLLDELLPFHEEGAEVTDADAVVAQWCRGFAERTPDSLRVTTELQAPIGLELGESQLIGLLKNLVHNARDAMSAAGSIHIRTFSERWSADDVRPEHLPPGDYFGLEVADDGPGVPPEVRARIFEPLFTTKGTGQGTGLGLSSAQGIAHAAGGCLQLIESSVGATFRIYLPRAETRGRTAAESPGLRAGG